MPNIAGFLGWQLVFLTSLSDDLPKVSVDADGKVSAVESQELQAPGFTEGWANVSLSPFQAV